MFDWLAFVGKYGLEYSDRGPSTAKDNIYVHCPFCGEADQGRHMGLSLAGKGWACWRDQSHRGRNPARLIHALLGVTWEEAAQIAGGERRGVLGGSGLLAAVRSALGEEEEGEKERASLKLPAFFKKEPYRQHVRYLQDERGFSRREVEEITHEFRLRFVLQPPGEKWARAWRWRVIAPIFNVDRKLMTWQGRAINDNPLRYCALSPNEEEGPKAIVPITDCFIKASRLIRGGRMLVINEGLFDNMKIALQAEDFGARVTCFFGKAISPTQLDFLASVRSEYDAVFLVLDPDARTAAIRMSSQLRALGISPFYLEGDEDPGDMDREKIRKLLGRMENRVARLRK